jgi:demethylmenaquinone methyltransferase/2-methoxy-6-polyprenyl-1,4-benzoquinol methylase
MSTYVLMRILESSPQRYDLGIRLLTLGGVDRAYERLCGHIREGERVLDIGCGTGALSLRAARNGAYVTGMDKSAEMLEMAARRAREAGLAEKVELREMGVAELDGVEAESFDAVTSGLCLSELSDDELEYTLRHVERILGPGGLLIVGDEVRPESLVKRLVHSLIRAPLAGITYLLAGQTTHHLKDLPAKVSDVGLSIQSTRTSAMGSFMELVARKPEQRK